MVPKQSGFNPQPIKNGLRIMRAHIVTGSRPPAMARDSVVLRKAAFLSSLRHNLPSKVRLRNKQTTRNVYCGCNNNAIFSDRAIFTFHTVSVFRQR